MISKYKKALVTGGAGFIGSHLCKQLIQEGLEVISIDNLVNGKMENIEAIMNHPNFTFADLDILDYEALKPYFEGVDVVFHEACSKNTVSLLNPKLDLEVNIIGTYHVLELARLNKVKKVVHASSGSVYGEPIIFPESEDHPKDPESYYGTSKLAGEQYCLTFNKLHDMNITVLRYFHVYGPFQDDSDKGGVVSIFTKKLLKDQQPTIYGDGSQLRSFTFVEDVVRANLFCAMDERTKGEAYNVASGDKITINELFKSLRTFTQKDHIEPIYEDWRIGDIKLFDVDNRKIKSLGFTFNTDFDTGLANIVQWMKQNSKSLQS